MCEDKSIQEVEDAFRRWGVVGKEKHPFITQRIGIALAYSTVLPFAAAACLIAYHCGCTFQIPGVRRAIYIGFFGLLGLTTRCWSYLNQGESPFPPYVSTYPLVTSFSCLAICAAPIELSRFVLLAPLLGFFVGYAPMDIYETVKAAIKAVIEKAAKPA